jgi:ParB family transcriptional regulator, chromosome partitioning protein
MRLVDDNISTIPISKITILNPRTRNKARFQEVISNIAAVGLKKPVTVSPRLQQDGEVRYVLACGQGRMEAYGALGQTEIPAIQIEATDQECFEMSLIENLARRRPSPLEFLQAIRELKARGYSIDEISVKIDRHKTYVAGILHLLENGEERLVSEVEKDRMPLSVAVAIATSDDAQIQQALTEAYENKSLRGYRLRLVRRIAAQRKATGKKIRAKPEKPDKPVSPGALLRAYRQESERLTLIVRKANLTGNRLLTIISALQVLLQDEHFRTVLRAESLNVMPPQLAERVAATRN